MSRCLVIVNLLTNLLRHVCWNGVSDVLGVHRKHPDHAFGPTEQIDEAIATTLSAPRCRPTQLSNPARAANDLACLGVLDQMLLQSSIFVVSEILSNQACKQRGFDKAEHCSGVRRSRTVSSCHVRRRNVVTTGFNTCYVSHRLYLPMSNDP